MDFVEEIEVQEPEQQQQDPTPKPKKKVLYEAVSKKYDLGTYDEFEKKLQDPAKRKALYDHIGKEFELGTYQEFESKITEPSKKKDLPEVGSIGAEIGGQVGASKAQSKEPIDELANQKKIFSGLNKAPTDDWNKMKSIGKVESKSVPKVGGGISFEEIDAQQKADLSKSGKLDENVQIEVPPTPLQIEENKKLLEKRNKNIALAIDNTTKEYFRLKGINAREGSAMYEEQKGKIMKSFLDGDVAFHMDLKTNTPRLDRITGLFENLKNGWDEANAANDEAATFVHDMNTQERVAYMKLKGLENTNQEPSPYLEERQGGLGWVGHTAGGAAPFLAKAGAGALIGAGALALAPETLGASLAGLPVAASFLFTAPDMANQGGMNETIRRYNYLKQQHPEMSDIDAMSQAESGILAGGIGGIAENALFMGSMKMPLSAEAKQVVGKFGTEMLQSGVNMGAATAAVDVAQKLEGNLEGYQTTPKEIAKSAVNTFIDNATVGAVLHGMIQGFPKLLNSAMKFAIKDVPKQDISETLNMNVEAGTISPEQAKKVAEDIDGYNEALNKINPKGLSKESQASIAGLIQAKDNLKKEAETVDESLRKPYDEKIEAINQQVADIQRTNKPFEHEVDDVTGNNLAKPTFDDVAKQRVNDVADKISKGKEISDVIDIQTQAKFPDQVEKQLNKILREEKASNKDKENPNTEISDNIEKYLEQNKKPEISVEPPKEIPEPIKLVEQTETAEPEVNPVKVEMPKEIPEPVKLVDEKTETVEVPDTKEEGSDTAPTIREVAPETKAGEPFVEEKRTILSHRGLQEVATEFGLDDISSRDRKSDMQLMKDAGETIDKWIEDGSYSNKVEGLVKDAEAKLPLNDEQRVILEQHIANVRREVSDMDVKSPDYDTRLKELQRLVNAGETTRSAAGASLRIPNISATANDLPTMMVREMNNSQVSELTDGQKATVQKEYESIKKANEALQQKVAQMEAAAAKNSAAKKVSETKATTPKTKKVHEDFVSERKKIAESISEKLKKARSEVNATPIPYAKELFAIAPDVAKLMKSYVEEGIVKLEEITKKIYDDLKPHIPQLQEKDIHDIIAGEYNEKKKTKNQISASIEDLRIQAKLVNKLDLILKGEEPKNERAKIKRNQEIEKLRSQIKDIGSFDKEVSDAKEAKLALAKKEGAIVEKDLGKAEKELDVADEKAAKVKAIEAEKEAKRLAMEAEKERKIKLAEAEKEAKRLAMEAEKERKIKLAEAEKERKQLEAEFSKEKRDEEKEKIKAALDKKKELERQLSYRTPQEYYLDKMKNNIKAQTAKLEEQLRTGNFAQEKTTLKLDKEGQELKNNLIKLKQERELRLMKQEYANRSGRDKAIDYALQVLNIPRTIMSSMDYSALLRQSLFSATSHPRTAGKAQIEAFKQSMSQKRFDEWFYDLKEDPRYELMQKSGLFVADPHDPRLSAKEESFMNNLAEKIPIAGKLIKGSERAYVGTLNKMRVDLFNRFAQRYEEQGKTFDNNPDFYKELANYINNSTGRGKLGFMESAAPVLNSLFFSPRLIASRINLMTMWANPRTYTAVPKEVRMMYMKDTFKFLAVGMSVLALAKLNGAQVEDDPRSTDFGKIKDGDTRYDIWGGFQPYVRVVAQILTGEKKSTTDGAIKDLNGEGAFGENRGDVITRFARGKLAPVPSMIWDVLSKRTTTGEKPTLASEAESHLLPLIYSDVKSAYQQQGVKSLFTVGVPSIFGVGVNTYSVNDKSGKKEKKTQKKAKPKKQQ